MLRFGKGLFLFFVVLLFVACSSEPLDPAAQAVMATQRAESAVQTAQYLEAEQVKAESAARQAEATAEYYRMLRTATVEAATMQAQATATERAWIAQQTQDALRVQQTVESWQITQTAVYAVSTATQLAVTHQAAIDAANVGIAQEALKQEQIRTFRQDYTKYAWAVLPFFLIVAIIVLALYGSWLVQRNRVLTQLADGKLVLVQDGKVIVPDRAPGPVLDPNDPPDITEGQLRVTENDQKVSAIRALAAGGQKDKAQKLAQSMSAQPQLPAPKVEVVDEKSVRPLLEDTLPAIYRKSAEE
ncbi:MAG: hypothetical protein ACOYYF_04560 [Chloroflexota bacterium]